MNKQNHTAAGAASSVKPRFHVMQQKASAIDPGYFIVATEEIADEAALFRLAKTILRNQVLVAVNDAALSMLLKLTLQRLGIVEDAAQPPPDLLSELERSREAATAGQVEDPEDASWDRHVDDGIEESRGM